MNLIVFAYDPRTGASNSLLQIDIEFYSVLL